MITGLFEIHITVDHIGDGMFKLYDYVSKNRGMKLILASAAQGHHPTQYMISKWCNGDHLSACAKSLEIENSMKNCGLRVLRRKVESMAHNPGVPNNEEELSKFAHENIYFEYHVKVDGIMPNYDLLHQIKNEINNPNYQIGVSVNLCGSKAPMLTLRIFDFQSAAEKIKNSILDYMKEHLNIHFMDAIQQEFSVCDTNPKLDEEWLI